MLGLRDTVNEHDSGWSSKRSVLHSFYLWNSLMVNGLCQSSYLKQHIFKMSLLWVTLRQKRQNENKVHRSNPQCFTLHCNTGLFLAQNIVKSSVGLSVNNDKYFIIILLVFNFFYFVQEVFWINWNTVIRAKNLTLYWWPLFCHKKSAVKSVACAAQYKGQVGQVQPCREEGPEVWILVVLLLRR